MLSILSYHRKHPRATKSAWTTYMDKKEYKLSLRGTYPNEPDEVLNLAWHFHSMEKAKWCIGVLATCTSYADAADKVIRPLYIACVISSMKALSGHFLTDLLLFTTMDRAVNAHSAAHHVRKVLADEAVRKARKACEAHQLQTYLAQLQSDGSPSPAGTTTIQLRISTDNEEFIRKIFDWVSENQAQAGTTGTMKVEVQGGYNINRCKCE